jgi:DNA-binding MarR family transcriptional regulator
VSGELVLSPLLKRVLREVAYHDGITAREVSLDANVREERARAALGQLQRHGLIYQRHHDYGRPIVRWHVTCQGRELSEQQIRERRARTDQEALLAAADPASIVTCPTCRGERVYCATCLGCRLVTAEQVAEVLT